MDQIKPERNCGLDLFRLTAMVMITVLHVNNQHLNLLAKQQTPSVSFAGCLLEYLCFCGVNCFALLTGFLARPQMKFDKKWITGIVTLWWKTVLFGGIVYLPIVFFSRSIPLSGYALLEIFTISGEALWYIGAYLGLLCFLPLISGLLTRFSKREQTAYLTVSFFLFSVLAVIFPSAGIDLNGGQSMLWLLICFSWGNILKNLEPEIRQWKNCSLILLSAAVAGGLLPFVYHWFHLPFCWRLMSYISPFCVIQAGALLLLFAKIRLRKERTKKVLAFFSKYSLGIYLFQAQPVIWENFIVRTTAEQVDFFQILWKLPALVLVISAAGILIYYPVEKFCALSKLPNRT